MKIVTDCAADMPFEEADELGVTVAPLFIQFPEGEVNSADLTPDQFYDRLEAMVPKIPTTALPSAGIFKELYEKVTQAGQEILSIHISSGLSGTINSARDGAQQTLDRMVHFFDSMTLSGGERFAVLAAARGLKLGWSLEKVLARLEQIRAKTEVIYTLDTLTYLARGGRIGRVQALAGSLLNLKPIIHVERSDGKYSTVGKARTISKAVAGISDYLAQEYGQARVWVTVLHGRFAEQAEVLSGQLQERLNIGKLEVMRISPVLGVHTGPGIVGAAVMPLDLMPE